jgi:hypothetical protein
LSIILAGEFGLLLLLEDTVAFDASFDDAREGVESVHRREFDYRSHRSSRRVREGRNAADYVREGESGGEADPRGRGDEVLIVEIWV